MNSGLDQHSRGQDIAVVAGGVSIVASDRFTPSSLMAEAAIGRWSEPTRRALNVTLAALSLILCAPFLLLLALVIKLSSPGPVIYKQTRVGLDRRTPGNPNLNGKRKVDYGGRLFTIYKFRTMAADSGEHQIWARPNDARVTPLGRVLRRYRLDELPQLVNVLKGDMNIVGPRPEQPKIVLSLREEIDGYTIRQRVLPGITGWAQVNRPYDESIHDVRAKLQYDLEYIEHVSVRQDIGILLRTIPVVVFGRGAR